MSHLSTAASEGLPAELDRPPLQFYCPLSKKLMIDPVQIESGVTYERSAILAEFASGVTACPVTGKELGSSSFQANTVLKRQLVSWLRAKKKRNSITAASVDTGVTKRDSSMSDSPFKCSQELLSTNEREHAPTTPYAQGRMDPGIIVKNSDGENSTSERGSPVQKAIDNPEQPADIVQPELTAGNAYAHDPSVDALNPHEVRQSALDDIHPPYARDEYERPCSSLDDVYSSEGRDEYKDWDSPIPLAHRLSAFQARRMHSEISVDRITAAFGEQPLHDDSDNDDSAAASQAISPAPRLSSTDGNVSAVGVDVAAEHFETGVAGGEDDSLELTLSDTIIPRDVDAVAMPAGKAGNSTTFPIVASLDGFVAAPVASPYETAPAAPFSASSDRSSDTLQRLATSDTFKPNEPRTDQALPGDDEAAALGGVRAAAVNGGTATEVVAAVAVAAVDSCTAQPSDEVRASLAEGHASQPLRQNSLKLAQPGPSALSLDEHCACKGQSDGATLDIAHANRQGGDTGPGKTHPGDLLADQPADTLHTQDQEHQQAGGQPFRPTLLSYNDPSRDLPSEPRPQAPIGSQQDQQAGVYKLNSRIDQPEQQCSFRAWVSTPPGLRHQPQQQQLFHHLQQQPRQEHQLHSNSDQPLCTPTTPQHTQRQPMYVHPADHHPSPSNDIYTQEQQAGRPPSVHEAQPLNSRQQAGGHYVETGPEPCLPVPMYPDGTTPAMGPSPLQSPRSPPSFVSHGSLESSASNWQGYTPSVSGSQAPVSAAAAYKSQLHQVSLMQRAADQAKWANKDRFAGWTPPAEALQGGHGPQALSITERAALQQQHRQVGGTHQQQHYHHSHMQPLQGGQLSPAAAAPGWAGNGVGSGGRRQWTPEFGFSSGGEDTTAVAYIQHFGVQGAGEAASPSAHQGGNTQGVIATGYPV